jgi:hypothetical protein
MEENHKKKCLLLTCIWRNPDGRRLGLIPTYRRAALLERCLEGLLLQALHERDQKVIVVSDGPDEIT